MIETKINIDVDDLDRAAEFYNKAFGLRPGRRFNDSVAEMLGTSSNIYLLSKPAAALLLPALRRGATTGGIGPRHILISLSMISMPLSKRLKLPELNLRVISTHTNGGVSLACPTPSAMASA